MKRRFALRLNFWWMCCVADLCLIDQLLCGDENALLSFEAIRGIHKLMDEDDDGTVDTAETDEVSGGAPRPLRWS